MGNSRFHDSFPLYAARALSASSFLRKVRRVLQQAHIDNALDLACNKLSALFDRADPKDFVDIFFICQEMMPFDRLLAETKRKHMGFDEYWLAISLAKVEDFTILPRMIKPLSLQVLKEFFKPRAEQLMKR
jgi:hypothetical protein